MVKRYHVIVEGRVQGVGFRSFCILQAQQRGLTGSVRNMSNGMVEIFVQGDEEQVDSFLKKVKKGGYLPRAKGAAFPHFVGGGLTRLSAAALPPRAEPSSYFSSRDRGRSPLPRAEARIAEKRKKGGGKELLRCAAGHGAVL